MKNVKGSCVNTLIGIVLSGVIVLSSVSGAVAVDPGNNASVNQPPIITVAENVQSSNTLENKCCKEIAHVHNESSRVSTNSNEIKENNSGVKYERTATKDKKKSQQFYRTKTGKCYHKDGCSYLRNSKIAITNEEIIEANLKPCSRCCK